MTIEIQTAHQRVNMQDKLPITITSEGQFSNALTPLLHKLEMWLNFQALKANWYENEESILAFHFTLIRQLEEKPQVSLANHWTIGPGYAFLYHSDKLTTNAYITIADLVKNPHNIEHTIKSRLTEVTNAVVIQHGFDRITC